MKRSNKSRRMKHSKKYTRKRHIKRKYNKKKYTKKRYTKRRHRRMRGGKPIGVGALVAAGAVGACLLGPLGEACRRRQARERAFGQVKLNPTDGCWHAPSTVQVLPRTYQMRRLLTSLHYFTDI